MAEELAQISIFLAKDGNTFESVIQEENLPAESKGFQIRDLNFDDAEMRFFCEQNTKVSKDNPKWLDFVNEQINPAEDKINFDTYSRRPSGLLLLNIDDNILAASFGVSGRKFIDRQKFHSDFGIKTAMNMCGNNELRQTKSRTHAITTKQIDRQLSRPSDAFDFGLGESELLKYISAQLKDNKNITLQGKDSLTVKIIGEEKLSWQRLLEYCRAFLSEYKEEKYKSLFPNYPNFQDVGEERSAALDERLVERIKSEDFSRTHLAIPEFIPDDEYSFSYSNHPTKENTIISHLDTADFKTLKIFDLENLEVKNLKSKYVYAYSHDEDRILDNKRWNLYNCIVAEDDTEDGYFVLSEGSWRKVDDDFYKNVNDFIEQTLVENDIPAKFHNIDISDAEKKQNREEVFNNTYTEKNEYALLFDKAKLRIGESKKDKEFCDILELNPDAPMRVIHVKKHGGASSINYLFSQARFYCEFFLSDEMFLSEIRKHISDSGHPHKDAFLEHIKEELSEVSGKDYEIGLWILYDKANGEAPKKSDLPLMAKYEIKLTYERLRNVNKYSAVSLSMIPVKQVSFKTAKKST